MKRWAILAMLVMVGIAQTGCGDGVVATRRERQERTKRNFDMDMRQLTDDWDYFWLDEQQSRLSRWHVE
jgi:hypothetical protein